MPRPAPTSVAKLRPTGVTRRAGRTVTAVEATVVDAFKALIAASFAAALVGDEFNANTGPMPRVGALRGGAYAAGRKGFLLRRASFVPGVRVTGGVGSGRRNHVRGFFRVAGPVAAEGRLHLRREVLSGVIGGHHVRVRFPLLRRVFGIDVGSVSFHPAQVGRALAPSRIR
jgi:hypothetical protein